MFCSVMFFITGSDLTLYNVSTAFIWQVADGWYVDIRVILYLKWAVRSNGFSNEFLREVIILRLELGMVYYVVWS